jgi:hypothetical protein
MWEGALPGVVNSKVNLKIQMSKTLEGEFRLETGWIFSNIKTGIYQCKVGKGEKYHGLTLKDNLYDCKIRYDLTTYHAIGAVLGDGHEYSITKGPASHDVTEVLKQIINMNENQ